MSHIGKEPIKIPKDLTIKIEKSKITFNGKLGSITYTLPPSVKINIEGNKLYIHSTDSKLWGTSRSNINCLILGVTQGISLKLQLIGIGYRAKEENGKLIINVGFSHPLIFDIPAGITIKMLKPTLILIQGIDYQLVTKVGSQIRLLKAPEPYKGKGIRYIDEIITTKEGKKK